MRNANIYNNKYIDNKKLTKKLHHIQLSKHIDNLMTSYTTYNKSIISHIRVIILIFVFALALAFILLYFLISHVEKINILLDSKTKDLEKSLVTITQNVIYSQTDLKGIITEASEAFCKISGYSLSELIGKPHNTVRSPHINSKIFKNLWETINEDKVWKGEIENIRKDGTFYWVSAIITPLYNRYNKKIGYTAIREDITDKNKINELNLTLENRVKDEVNKSREKDKQLLQQSRLAQMGEMISMIAHQWRQPLTAISSTSSAMNLKSKLGKLDKDMTIELTDNISRYAQHLSTTIDDFRDFFKSNKKEKVTNFNEIIQSVLGIVSTSIETQNINITKELNCDEELTTYPNELKQVTLNIIKNAEDILIEKEIKNPYIKISTCKEKDSFILKISDNGGGISEDILNHIFDPYFSTKKKKDGTGLGLYMSKTIIEDHCHGELIALNTNDGAAFIIKLYEKEQDK